MSVKTVPMPARPAPGGADRVLQAKIMAPSVPGWMVPRPRLEKRIDEGTAGPLTVVTGPPGAGKTMAVASWAAAKPGPVAWVTLDHYDSNPKVFWATVVAALRNAGVTLRRVSAAPARTAGADHVFLLRLASELAAQDPPVALVLDDLHLLAGTGLMDGLQYLLRNARPGLRLVACSRADPLLPLHRYRLAGELTEIRASELAFSVPEAGLLMAQHGITLPPRTLELLTNRDEGWAAGLRLAAISLDDHPDPGQFIKELAAENSAIAGYLVEEALNNQPPEIRDLLLKTSILDRVNSGIAGELTGHEQASTLAALVRANAFVQPLGNGWYRYHSLFAEVLRLKLRLECPGEMPDLRRRAARWYQVNGLLLDAVRQAVAAEDWPLAAQMVLDELAIGQLSEPHDPLADCFRQMPYNPTWTGPQSALIAAALALADLAPVAACAALDVAEEILGRLPDDTETPARLAAAVLRLMVARRAGDLGAAAAATDKVSGLVSKLPGDILTRHAEIHTEVLSARGVVQFWSGHFDEAAASLDAGTAAAALSGSMSERTDCHGYLALLEALRGRLNRAAELAAEAGPAGQDGIGMARPACGAAEVALALVHLERNERHDARDRLKRADAALRVRPDRLVGAAACLVVARYRLAEGRVKAASEMIARARHGWSPPGWLDHTLTLLESRAYAAAGDFSSAVGMAERANPGACIDATVALAHARLDAGDDEAASQALQNGPDDIDEAHDRSRLDHWLVDARLGYSRGGQAHGRRSLQRALGLAEPEQLRLPFAMQAAWIRPVLRSDPHLADAHRHLLEPGLIDPDRGRTELPVAGQAAPVIVEQLSGREREVLSLLSGMLSTAEVASELYISVNTVKTHLKSIYRKLAATHRGEAVRRARQLELLLERLELR